MSQATSVFKLLRHCNLKFVLQQLKTIRIYLVKITLVLENHVFCKWFTLFLKIIFRKQYISLRNVLKADISALYFSNFMQNTELCRQLPANPLYFVILDIIQNRWIRIFVKNSFALVCKASINSFIAEVSIK